MTTLVAPSPGTGDVLLSRPWRARSNHAELTDLGSAGRAEEATGSSSGTLAEAITPAVADVIWPITSPLAGSTVARAARDVLVMWDPTPLDINASFTAGLRTAFETFRTAFDSADEAPSTVDFLANGLGRFVIGPDSAARWDRPFVRTSGSWARGTTITTLHDVDVFGDLLPDPSAPMLAASSPTGPDPASAGVVTTIRSLETELGVPLKDVLSAADIRKRTFHAWDKPNKPQPRVASQGLLWRLVDVVDDVRELIAGPVQPWLHADSVRLDALRDGRFDELVEMAIGTRTRRPSRSRYQGGLGGDMDLPLVRSADPSAAYDVNDVDEV